ncbi:MAG TPA: two-component regulator propeller domain-containing protein [Ohtaekwangia sp.]|uniref:ligand-binding sensor domain-containing protein n=1 Tax=Ohtaekwangia sp. TaxID=2066019 RepID=UPI002F92CE8D
MRDNILALIRVLCKIMGASRFGILVILFSLFAKAGLPQNFTYSTRNYTAVDGLPQSQVRSLVEDKNGYLWMATQGGGLARFDGKEFKVYTTKDGLLSNDISSLLFDHHDNLWILHAHGVTRFNGYSFKRFHDPKFQNAGHRRLYERNDSIFVVANGNIGKIFQDSLYYWGRPLVHNKVIWKSYHTTVGVHCFFMKDGSCHILTPKTEYSFDVTDDIGKIYYPFEYKGDIVLRTDKGYFRVDHRTQTIEPLKLPIKNMILLYDEKGDFFWTRDGSNLFRDVVSKNEEVKRDTVLRDVSVLQVVNDSEGNTWFASDGRGLYKYFIQDFNRCSSENLRGVMAILTDRCGTKWLGTLSKGLWKINKGKSHAYVDKHETSRNNIGVIQQSPDGTIWVGSMYGLGRYDSVHDKLDWFTREEGLPSNTITSIEFDEAGTMWVGTGGGLSRFDGQSFHNYTTTNGLLSNGIWHLHYSKRYKTLYIATDISIQTIRDEKIGVLQIPGLNNTSVMSILPYQDSLLALGTGGAGVVIYNPKSRHRKFITTQEGLASDFIYFAAADEKRKLWIGTEKGINRVKLARNLEIEENLYFGYDNGLTGVETNLNAFELTPNNKYFGLVDGLYAFNDISSMPARSFDLHLTNVQILYGEYDPRQYADTTEGFFRIPVNPRLPADRNHVTFYFNRVDKRYPKSIKFKYYLENFDKKWSQPSSMTEVTYSNLPPGNYVLHVMSTDKQGSWSYKKIAYPFSIKAPFYQTASFMVGVVVLLAGIITLILYLRVRQKVSKMLLLERIRAKEQETLRKEIARDFHDEMGNQLTRIINYISLLKLNGNGNSNGSGDLYTKVEDSAKYLYTGTRDFIWSIDPVNDELSKLFIHIRDFGEKLFEEKNIQFRAFNEVKDKIKLPYGFSREANLIFKEAMTNAFKYSNACNVTLLLRRSEPDGFEMSFEDDGVGFLTDEIEKSNGLQNIRERADRIRSVLRITSVEHRGTKITLNFKLTKTLKYGLAL